MFDIITMGSATVDCFVDTGKKLFQNPCMHKGESVVHVPFGSKIIADKLTFKTGGGGTNTAVSFARLGLKTGYIGKLGGEQALMVLDELKAEGVSTSLIVPDVGVGFSVVLDAKGEDRTILTHKGCNNMLRYQEINKSKLKTKWFYMASMMGRSYETLLKVMEFAKKKGIKIAFNPSSYIAKQGYKRLNKFLKCTDILVLNKEEAIELLGREYDIIIILKKLKELVNGIVVVTDGGKGCHCLADKYYHIKTSGIRPHETTGAGDAFASGFVAGQILGQDVEYSLQMGQANAESVITAMGAKNILLTYRQMRSVIKKKPGKIISKEV